MAAELLTIHASSAVSSALSLTAPLTVTILTSDARTTSPALSFRAVQTSPTPPLDMIDEAAAPGIAGYSSSDTTRSPVQDPILAQPSVVVDAAAQYLAAPNHWFWSLITLVTSWLALKRTRSHVGCNLLLRTLRLIFVGLRVISEGDKVPITTTTSFHQLGLHDDFNTHPLCPACHEIYPPDSPFNKLYVSYGTALFRQTLSHVATPGDVATQSTGPMPSHATKSRSSSEMELQAPQRPISDALTCFLSQG
ncbi:hypothetical protein C8Q80DRAFT_1275653 [Daedaleopsis nitida]|nr:hypothetical protein C8Q80DRAFT_1275653 [Daedaleopsis nitida]